MKVLLTFLVFSLCSFTAFAQTASESAMEGSDVETMGAQEEIYEGTDTTTTPQAEEDVSEPGLQGTDESMIQEEVDTTEEETMRSDTMEGSQSPEGSESTSPGTTTP
ncbi:MAG: hypothetical protein WDA09_09455 [Bacteriovoracaceae bacterium]